MNRTLFILAGGLLILLAGAVAANRPTAVVTTTELQIVDEKGHLVGTFRGEDGNAVMVFVSPSGKTPLQLRSEGSDLILRMESGPTVAQISVTDGIFAETVSVNGVHPVRITAGPAATHVEASDPSGERLLLLGPPER